MKRTALIAGMLSLVFCGRALAQPSTVITEEHKILHQEVGSWNVKMRLWPEGPEGALIEGVCQEQNRLLGDGLWVISNFKGTFGGIAFEGHGTYGYNTHKKKYVGTWIDTMNSAVSTMEGTYDKESKTLTMFSTGTEPDGKEMKTKNVAKYIDENTRTFTMSNLAPGSKDKYVKMMELQYTRKDKK